MIEASGAGDLRAGEEEIVPSPHSPLGRVPYGQLIAIGLLLLLVASTLVFRGIFLDVLTVTCIYAGAALAWNILAGFGGQMSLGHGAFFGAGAYTMGILYVHYHVSPWLGLLLGGVVGMIFGLLVGLPTFRLRGPYFALATLALAEALRRVVVWDVKFTGGVDGINLPIRYGFADMLWDDYRVFAWMAIAFMGVAWLVSLLVRNSRLGYYLAAVREDEDVASAAGVNPLLVKSLGMAISAFLTGVGGAIMGKYLGSITPDDYLSVAVSTQLLVITYVGGLGTLAGPVLGAFLAIPGAQWLRFNLGSHLGSLYLVIYGLAFILIILFYPKGLFPGLLALGGWAVRTGRRLAGRPTAE